MAGQPVFNGSINSFSSPLNSPEKAFGHVTSKLQHYKHIRNLFIVINFLVSLVHARELNILQKKKIIQQSLVLSVTHIHPYMTTFILITLIKNISFFGIYNSNVWKLFHFNFFSQLCMYVKNLLSFFSFSKCGRNEKVFFLPIHAVQNIM